jgi:hypothetical protein
MPNDTPEWALLLFRYHIAIGDALTRVVGRETSEAFCIGEVKLAASERLETQQRRETAVRATSNEQLWKEACEAMRQTALRPLINTGYYPSVRYVDAPPLPPQYSDPPAAGGHVPGSPHSATAEVILP